MIAVDNLDALSQTQLRQTVELLMTELRHKSALVDKLTHEMAVLKRLKYAATSEKFCAGLPAEQKSLLEETLDTDLAQLAAEAQEIDDPLERLKHLLRSFWRDIPREEGGFANNIIQAISGLGNEQGYRPTLLRWMKAKIQALVLDCLPPERRAMFEGTQLGHFMVMAFDGFIVYHHLEPRRPLDERTLDALCRTLLGLPGPAQPKSAKLPNRGSSKNTAALTRKR